MKKEKNQYRIISANPYLMTPKSSPAGRRMESRSREDRSTLRRAAVARISSTTAIADVDSSVDACVCGKAEKMNNSIDKALGGLQVCNPSYAKLNSSKIGTYDQTEKEKEFWILNDLQPAVSIMSSTITATFPRTSPIKFITCNI
ncbi:coldregulated gene 27 [Striga asiatica]|uniref:Coldregulated gene 27 n=1 Tax=Striga asiatica TaxID=4170 RepID=A0A5A7R0D6_STRAF|nr:coldregulated gene 27 [Striga asiatica]